MYLAIDTSSETTGLAVTHGGAVLAELTWHCHKNHTVELLPHIESILRQCGLNIKDMQAIIVARGPGSFNGLRVGLGTAKGLAFSLGVPIVGISTLEAAAYQHAGSGLPVCAIFDAGRGEIACAMYQLKDGDWQCLAPEGLTTASELCERIQERTVFCGEPGAATLQDIQARLGDKALIPADDDMLRHPASLAALGEKRLKATPDDAATLQPIYLRRPHISPPKSRSAGAAAPGATSRRLAIIWDMDGTIVDTAELHFAAWQTVFTSRHIPFSREDFRRGFGMRNDSIIRDILGPRATPEEIDAISREKTGLFRDAVNRQGVHAMPGAKELLTALHERGVPMAVASSAPRQNAETFLQLLGIENLFQAVVSGEEVTHGKPAPDIFLLAAKKLGAEAHCCVVIEDAVGGIAGAHAAGMHSIGVAANHTRESLKLADLVVDSLAQVSAADIEKLLQT